MGIHDKRKNDTGAIAPVPKQIKSYYMCRTPGTPRKRNLSFLIKWGGSQPPH